MKNLFVILLLGSSIVGAQGCGHKQTDPATKPIKDQVKEVVTQPLATYEAAKDSLKTSEDKAKSALEALDGELKH